MTNVFPPRRPRKFQKFRSDFFEKIGAAGGNR